MVEFNVGDKVTYDSGFGPEKGIIKSVSIEANYAYVVYKCDKDWDNFRKYTGELTALKYLTLGWPNDE